MSISGHSDASWAAAIQCGGATPCFPPSLNSLPKYSATCRGCMILFRRPTNVLKLINVSSSSCACIPLALRHRAYTGKSPARNMASRRLARIQSELTPSPATIGSLTFGDITVDLPASATPSRLPHLEPLDVNGAGVRDDLHWMLQKFLLGQDIFLLGQPGPYARKLVMTFCS